MHPSPVEPNVQFLPLAILLMATTLSLSVCSVTCGQENQDHSKTYQVEAPIVDALVGKHAKTNKVGKAKPKQEPIQLDLPFIGKGDIERPTEALLKTAALPLQLSNLFNDLESPETNNLASLFAGHDVKQPANPLPASTPSDGAFSKALIETPPKLLLDLAGKHSELKSEVSKSNATPDRENEPTASSTPQTKSNRDNPAVQPGRVHWLADLATATERSKQSGKPVFHFQLLGQLDQRFT